MPLPQPCHAIILDDAGILPAEMYELMPRPRTLGGSCPLVSPGIVDGKTLLTSTLEVMVGNVTAADYTVNKGDVLGYISVLDSPAISTVNTDATSVATLSAFIAENKSFLPSVEAAVPGTSPDLGYHPIIVIQPDFGGLVHGINSAVASDGKRMQVVLMISYDETRSKRTGQWRLTRLRLRLRPISTRNSWPIAFCPGLTSQFMLCCRTALPSLDNRHRSPNLTGQADYLSTTVPLVRCRYSRVLLNVFHHVLLGQRCCILP